MKQCFARMFLRVQETVQLGRVASYKSLLHTQAKQLQADQNWLDNEKQKLAGIDAVEVLDDPLVGRDYGDILHDGHGKAYFWRNRRQPVSDN